MEFGVENANHLDWHRANISIYSQAISEIHEFNSQGNICM